MRREKTRLPPMRQREAEMRRLSLYLRHSPTMGDCVGPERWRDDQACKQSGATQSGTNGSASGKVAIDQRKLPQVLSFVANFLASFVAATAFLLLLSRLLLPSWQFIPSVYLTPLQLPDLTPNPGLWWYFFVEMFDAFRSFFLGVFWLHMLAYSWPLCIRLRKQPLAATVLMMGIISILEPYASIGAAATWLSSLCLLGHAFERKSVVTAEDMCVLI